MHVRAAAGAALVALLACCTGARPQPTSAPAPLVHRFTEPARWSKEFDDPARDAWQKPSNVVGAMRITPGMTVADVGAGTGYFEAYLSRAVGPTGVVVAVDIEPEMVRWIEDRRTRENWANVHAQLGETGDPKLPAGRIDRVLIVDTWHHIPEPVRYASKLRSAMAAGGTITIVEFTLDAPRGPPKEHRVAPATLIDELHAAGFAVEQIDAGLPYQYLVVAR